MADVKVPPVAYLGFSAETGELADNHDIISLATKNLYQPTPAGVDGQPPAGKERAKNRAQKLQASRGKKGGEGGGWGWFLFKFVVFGLVLTGAYVGFTAYRSQRMRSRF